jgi:hypothetical protein
MFAIGCRSFRGIGIVCVGDDAGLAQISQLAPEYVAGFSIKTVKFKSIIFVGDNPVPSLECGRLFLSRRIGCCNKHLVPPNDGAGPALAGNLYFPLYIFVIAPFLGKLVYEEVPSPLAPRNCDQFSWENEEEGIIKMASIKRQIFFMAWGFI